MRDDLLVEAARLAQGPSPETAAPLVDRLLRETPGDADALTLAGLVAQRTGRGDEAIVRFTAARDAEPGHPARHQNLAVALKGAGRFDDALAAFEEALRLRPGHAATLANMASCLLAADRPAEALALIEGAADHPDLCNNRGVALARLGRRDEAAQAYARALALRPGHVETRLNLADVAGEAEAERLAAAVLAEIPGHPRAANQLGLLRERAGDHAGAARALAQGFDAARPHHALGINLARNLIRAGEAERALRVCEQMLAVSPSVTTPLALASVALDRMGQGAARDTLMGIDRFVTVHDIEAVEGFTDLATFNAALVGELAAHPSLVEEPEGLVTRQGRQSDELADDRTPAIAALGDLARTKVAREQARLAAMDRNHPFLRAMPGDWSLTLWGTILRAGGEVGAHIHAPNWLSGVYYPDFADGEDGAFAIGVLPDELGGLDLPHRVFRPKTGRMILFPSYLWHGTLPFGGKDRVSFAFDLVPAGIGNPHRLARRG
ncbi:tetratricopeptide repeat protein [Croceicoccus sp. BE223]|uniref:tetratricopeptide repeat protein n=1 Tax=Croceicoccus sp. BE223 TaxID=2817716 RepID=UPI002857C83D|nr:tetratricopeptide repeat protein [Croceicoccus sp. BE223]MDR7101309.1 tetratricopeptide (TPR) repeat protein [Croceicoccus sp. BE223]